MPRVTLSMVVAEDGTITNAWSTEPSLIDRCRGKRPADVVDRESYPKMQAAIDKARCEGVAVALCASCPSGLAWHTVVSPIPDGSVIVCGWAVHRPYHIHTEAGRHIAAAETRRLASRIAREFTEISGKLASVVKFEL